MRLRGDDGRDLVLLDGVSLDLRRGETVVLAGESGSGKTTLARTILGLLPEGARVVAGSVTFERRVLSSLGEADLESVRGKQIALISQEPGLALNPVLRVGRQVAEVLAAHDVGPRRERRAAVEALFDRVGLPEPGRIHDAYPHELSGGQRQRVAIAQAIACGPALLLADEPTTALDPVSQARILSLLEQLRRELNLALLLISHDLATAAPLADRLAVMYAGRIVEQGPRGALLAAPRHPYTRALLAARPPAGSRAPLRPIPGAPPDPAAPLPGCAFEPRCPDAREECRARVPRATRADDREVRCVDHGG